MGTAKAAVMGGIAKIVVEASDEITILPYPSSGGIMDQQRGIERK